MLLQSGQMNKIQLVRHLHGSDRTDTDANVSYLLQTNATSKTKSNWNHPKTSLTLFTAFGQIIASDLKTAVPP